MVAKTILLDLDGTVWDSRLWYANVIAELSGANGSEIVTWLEAGESVSNVSRKCGVSRSRLEKVAKQSGSSMVLYDGVIVTLDRLRARGTLIGVVSNLAGWLARR